MNKPELLAPGGSLEKLKTAIDYGADAVYIGGDAFSLRVAAENFTLDEMRQGLKYAHDRDRKVYLTANIIPHNRDIAEFENFIEEIRPLGFDAVLIADLGMFSMVRELAPELPVHISTQANNTNYRSALMWHSLGASRIVLGREMSFEEIRGFRNNIPPELELEVFVHGAMCISYSGRCLLSNYMTGRNSNMGACAHPCRWNYTLMEEKRPGEYFDVEENERGTFIFNSKDLCMIEHIPELCGSGITSFKIEGRVKTAFYVATIVGAYRREIDRYFADPKGYVFDPDELLELSKISHRPYTTGFFFGRPGADAQVYETSSYIRDYELVGIVTAYDEKKKRMTVTQRNRFFEGDELEIMQPGKPYISIKAESMRDDTGEPITVAPHPEQIVTMAAPEPLCIGAMIRKKRQ